MTFQFHKLVQRHHSGEVENTILCGKFIHDAMYQTKFYQNPLISSRML